VALLSRVRRSYVVSALGFSIGHLKVLIPGPSPLWTEELSLKRPQGLQEKLCELHECVNERKKNYKKNDIRPPKF